MATRRVFWALIACKMHLRPDPAGVANSAPPDTLAHGESAHYRLTQEPLPAVGLRRRISALRVSQVSPFNTNSWLRLWLNSTLYGYIRCT